MYDLNKQLEIAIKIAVDCHKGQYDKGGELYILHPLHIMDKVGSIECKIIAVLHDSIEDTWVDDDYLREMGINEDCVEAIVLLTRKKNQSYMDYIKEINTNFYAKTVKMEDLKHNMDLSRIDRDVTEKDLDRNRKYLKAYYYLLNN